LLALISLENFQSKNHLFRWSSPTL